ncbi:MAG: DNA polymerase III subunit delta [Methylococcales bacterium]
MAFPVEQLKLQLDKQILPVYLVYGEEPQQVSEALDLIRKKAALSGFSERIRLFTESNFDWTELRSELEASPLFAQKRIIDLRLSTKQPTKAGTKILEKYLSCPINDIVLLLSAEKLSKTVSKTGWFKQVKSIGYTNQFWPLTGQQLLQWLTLRAKQRGLNLEPDCIRILAARIEGNMLAAAQEIEKLYLDFGQNRISAAEIEQWVTDQSRYDVFSWVENTLEGRLSRSQRILKRMQLEGVAPVLVVWAISRELRLLLKLSESMTIPGDSPIKNIWGKRKQTIQRAMVRLDQTALFNALACCGYTDRVIKGIEQGDAWQSLETLSAMICVAPNQLLPIEIRQYLGIQQYGWSTSNKYQT